MALAQRPRIGLKDVVYAVLNESSDVVGGTASYGTVYPLANSLDLSYDPGSSSASLFADDGLAFAAETVGEMKISLGNADILPEDIARILGHAYALGQIVDNSLDQSPYIAIGAKMLRSGKDSTNLVYDYIWMYKCKLQKPKFDAKTKGASIEFQTPMLEGLVCQLTSSGNYRLRMRTDDANAVAATLTGFFTTVVLPSASLTAVTVGTPFTGSASAHTITIPFAKGGESFSMAIPNVKDITVSIVSTGLLVAGTSTITASVAGTAPTLTITNANIAGVSHLVAVTSDVKDINGVSVTATSRLVTPA
jgi:phi13 family phage major tail protein